MPSRDAPATMAAAARDGRFHGNLKWEQEPNLHVRGVESE
jgi:hypothetical protein